MAAMQHDNLKIEIEGSEIQELYNDLVSLEVELDEELAGMFRMNIALLLQGDGTWNYIDDDRLTIWKQVAIIAGLEDDTQQLISGYITRSEEHTSELQSLRHLVCRLLLEKKKLHQEQPRHHELELMGVICAAFRRAT